MQSKKHGYQIYSKYTSNLKETWPLDELDFDENLQSLFSNAFY